MQQALAIIRAADADGLTDEQTAQLTELGLDATDGTGACLSWPLVDSAAALISELSDDDSPSQPAGIEPPVIQSLYDPDDPTVLGRS